ncbi:hypothetical protein NKH77_23310 [Streptomyces sp. M19]
MENGDPPRVENAISPEILAGLAYGRLQVPSTDVDMSPGGKQTVNLPTWVWLDNGRFRPISVTARVPGLDIHATTSARPVSLHISPAHRKPASIRHPANAPSTPTAALARRTRRARRR